jgi:hypothetical protein
MLVIDWLGIVGAKRRPGKRGGGRCERGANHRRGPDQGERAYSHSIVSSHA